MGGILGQGVAKVSITNCGNSGKIYLNDSANNSEITAIYERLTMGGILGAALIANSTVTDCDNSGDVYCAINTKLNKRLSYVGGIVGLMGATDGVDGLVIANCNNTSPVNPHNFNNQLKSLQSSLGGGIVGAICGTAASKASLHDCTVSTGRIYNYRGTTGGIAGLAKQATISDSTVSSEISGNGNSEMNGGLVGWCLDSSLSNCEYSGSISGVKDIGGLIGYMDSGSMTSCKLNGATITTSTNAAAVLVSNAASGTTISNCGIKGTLDGAAIDLDSNMITTDSGATVTGTYLLP